MKAIAIVVSILGFSVLHASRASADITDIQCNDAVIFQEFNNPPAFCVFGNVYDAGDVGIFRTCSFHDSTVSSNPNDRSSCGETFTESFFHFANPVFGPKGQTGCTDGGFFQQVNSNVQGNCPF